MPIIAGKNCLTTTFYIRSPKRLMSFAWFWEPETIYPDLDSVHTAANDAATLFNPLIAALLGDANKAEQVKCVFENDSTYLDAFSDSGLGVVGTANISLLTQPIENVLPDQDAVIIQKRTGGHGRTTRGRVFVPGIWEGFNDDGVLSTDGRTPAGLLAQAFGSDQVFAGITCHSRHWSRTQADLLVLSGARAMINLGSRRDRQVPYMNLPI